MNDFKDLFKNTVFGDNTTILVGNHNSQEVQNKKMMKGNFKIIKEELLKHGVDEPSIDEPEKILDKDKPDEKAKKPGEKVQGWMTKMYSKALEEFSITKSSTPLIFFERKGRLAYRRRVIKIGNYVGPAGHDPATP